MIIPLPLASAGTIAGATVALETLKMPSETVGIFSAFDIFTRNAAAAFDITNSMLEQLDAARGTGRTNHALKGEESWKL